MVWARRFWLRFETLLRRNRSDQRLDDEIQFHLEQQIAENVAAGMSPEEARYAAMRTFGNPTFFKEETRDTWGRLRPQLAQDIRYGLRMLRKSPGFTSVAILTLTLAIGANTAMFSVIRAVLLKPLEYHEPDRLVRLVLTVPKRHVPDQAFNQVRFDEMQAASHSFSALGAFGPLENLTLSGNGESEVVNVARVSANFLSVLGVQKILGRSFLPEEDRHGGPRVALISSGLWHGRFHNDPQIVGKTATLDEAPYTIVGVLPPGFAFPVPDTDVWVTRPSEWSALPPPYWRTVGLLKGFARLNPQVTLEQAKAEMSVLQRSYALAHPNPNDADPSVTMGVVPLKDQVVANVSSMLWMLFDAVGLLLLIACGNLASLSLGRASSRSREFAIRASMGAGRARLVGQLLVESLLLATAGGASGVLLAKWSLHAITRVPAFHLPRTGEIRLDGLVLGFTLLISVATGILFGLFPSLSASRPDLADVLRGSVEVASQRVGRLLNSRGLLVAGQVALSTVLLIGTGLLLKSFARLHCVDPGFRTTNLLTAKIALPRTKYDTDVKKEAFFQELLRRVSALPGVSRAAAALSVPTKNSLATNILQVEGVELRDKDFGLPDIQLQSVTPGYFQTLGIPLERGREFTAQDNMSGAPPVVMINESLARLLWPNYPDGSDPIGRHIREGADKAIGKLEIVGVAGDVREKGLTDASRPEFYVPFAVHPPQRAYLVVDTQSGEPLSLANMIRSKVLAIDQDQAISDVHTMEEVIEESIGQRRMTMVLAALFASVALLLAVVGIYGLVAYSVAKRTQEVGIRRALGAQRSDVLRLVLGQGLALALSGVGAGVFGALALNRVMKEFLFQISATDPATFIGVAVLFIGVAFTACFIPAARAIRIDPMEALRYE